MKRREGITDMSLNKNVSFIRMPDVDRFKITHSKPYAVYTATPETRHEIRVQRQDWIQTGSYGQAAISSAGVT